MHEKSEAACAMSMETTHFASRWRRPATCGFRTARKPPALSHLQLKLAARKLKGG